MFGELILPIKLVQRAHTEMARDGRIWTDTAALLIENGADMHRLEQQVTEQIERLLEDA